MKKINYIFGLILFVSMTFLGCKKEETNSKAQFRLFNLEKVGWKSKTLSHHLKGINYKATQVPLQYYILKSSDDLTAVQVDSIYNRMSNERVIEFEFQHDTKDDLLKDKFTNKDYTAAVEYMAFKIENDFSIETESGKKIKCSGAHFERNFKLAPFKRLLLHFGNVPENDKIKLIYKDQLFGNGLLKYHFKETPIKL